MSNSAGLGRHSGTTAARHSGGRSRRRRRDALKRQTVAEAHQPGVSVPMVAQRYTLNANQVFRSRSVHREPERAGGTGWSVPLVVEAAPSQEPDAATTKPPSESVVTDGQPTTGRMETILPCGRKVNVGCTVDGPALSRVISVLEGR